MLADGLKQEGMPKPAVVEAYNVVEKSTHAALVAGGDGQGTLIGNLLEDTAKALRGTVSRWEPVKNGNAFHLRIHLSYP